MDTVKFTREELRLFDRTLDALEDQYRKSGVEDIERATDQTYEFRAQAMEMAIECDRELIRISTLRVKVWHALQDLLEAKWAEREGAA